MSGQPSTRRPRVGAAGSIATLAAAAAAGGTPGAPRSAALRDVLTGAKAP